MLRTVLLAAMLATPALAADRLPGLAADTAAWTVSGVSAGGYMAIQFHVAHSSKVSGVAALAAGPYYCAQGSFWSAYYACTTPSTLKPLPPVEALNAQAERYAREARIDPLANLARARVWLFSGTEDRTVQRPVVEAAHRFYASLGAQPVFVKDQRAGHGMVTESAGNACATTRRPFINRCDYDAAGVLLRHLLGARKLPAGAPSGRVVAFDQKPFAGGSAHAIALADDGYAYVPKACEASRCRVHVAFHGCRQSADAIGERFVREAGYNRWADAHRLVVLYPQATARYGWRWADGQWSYIWNPRGCWDWWGYTGAQYATKAGAQVRAVYGMVMRVGERRGK
jgi:poly(3-hydroxybutyrate) depolymerase